MVGRGNVLVVMCVVGAVWLFSTLRELYLVQLFARWGSQAIARYIQLSPLQEQHNFAARAMHAFSIQQFRQQVRQRLAIESSERSTSCQDIIKDIFPAMRQHQQQLLKTIEQRIQVLESTVGEGAVGIRNLASSKSKIGCVHRARESGDMAYTVCGWKYVSAAYVRVALDVLHSFPSHQLCALLASSCST